MIGAFYTTHDTLYNGGRGGLMSCDVLVTSEAGGGQIILWQSHRVTAEIKTSASAGKIMLASCVTSQQSHLTTDISYNWVE